MDFLEEDTITIPSQKFALISIVSPQSNQKANISAMKIKGVFEHKEDAQKYVSKLMQHDDTYDIYLVDMYKWLAVPPDVTSIEGQVHQEKQLNDIIQGHKEQQLLAKSHFEERKRFEVEKKLEKRLEELKNGGSSEIDPSLVIKQEDLQDLVWKPGKPLSEEEFKKMRDNNEDVEVITVPTDVKGKSPM
jgi:hypothetical protein